VKHLESLADIESVIDPDKLLFLDIGFEDDIYFEME
jgi:hypothetical protein